MLLQISSVRNQKPEVGLQELIPVVWHGFGRRPAKAPPTSAVTAPPPPAVSAIVSITVILEVQQVISAGVGPVGRAAPQGGLLWTPNSRLRGLQILRGWVWVPDRVC